MHRQSLYAILWIPLFVLLFHPQPLLADDGYVQGVGGTIKLMREHSSIVMVAERVIVDLSPERADVDCLFTFKNTGPATTVKMGFPESSGGTDVSVKDPHGFSYFKTWVDGVRVPSRIEGLKGDDRDWERWRVKTVHFKAGQKRLVRVRYEGGMGSSSDGTVGFSYRLDTGASWQGPIGNIEVIVHLKDMPVDVQISGTPAGFQRKKDQLVWRWKNLEPGGKTAAIGLSFYPGYRSIIFNGKSSFLHEFWGPPILKQSRLWASLDSLSHWTGGSVQNGRGEDISGNPYRSANLVVGKQVINLQVGQRKARLNGKVVQLQHAPFIKYNYLYVPVNEIITLLGGTAYFDKKSKTTYLALGKKTPSDSEVLQIYEDGKWKTYRRGELRKKELQGSQLKQQQWRKEHLQVLNREALSLLPKEFIQPSSTPLEREEFKDDPYGIDIRRGKHYAQFRAFHSDAYAVLYRINIDGKDTKTIKLEQLFESWWYLTEIKSNNNMKQE